jgi:hypothetical protein
MSWEDVNFKLGEAGFFFGEMYQALIPASVNGARPAYELDLTAGGGMVDNRWQSRFYYHVDAFLAATWSTADIIQAWF